MYFNKIHHPLNFIFADRYHPERQALLIGEESFDLEVTDLGDDVFRVSVRNARWAGNPSQAELETRTGGDSRGFMTVDSKACFCFSDPEGAPVLQTDPAAGFGVSGTAWMFKFAHDAEMRFYGMGEKALGFELSGQRTKFWNTDLWADFHFHKIVHESCDPLYISLPWLVVARGNRYVGMLLDNPHAAFIATNPNLRIAEQSDADDQPLSDFYVGAPDGQPDVYFIGGPTLAEVTARMQRLVGCTPRPPLWALGHHQCRWGYRNEADLQGLADAFEQHAIPCSALWLDIDYMDGFRVFTFNDQHFSDPLEQFRALKERGFRVVPILDPGVKMDPGFSVYRDGMQEGAFCQNPAGTPYVGFVWPGATVFPDFSIEGARNWWSENVKRFAGDVIDGVWIDMNDPSTGASDPGEMLFDEGRQPHDTFHNQYALGMAKATREGLLRANPDRRPFVLSRSAFLSMARHAAVWNGDNYSNEHHLRQSIPVSLSLSLSGLPFCGPDVPGFGGDASGELAALWYQAGFLFPFFRNHSATGTASQEPWAFGGETLRIVREFIRLRYKLLPYIYNLFIEQEREGHPIMRPMIYHFENTLDLPLDRVSDQFMLGPDLLHAPFLSLSEDTRSVALPTGLWYDLMTGDWVTGGRVLHVRRTAPDQTPLFARHGAIMPMAAEVPATRLPALNNVEWHAFFAPGEKGEFSASYEWDDGETFAYRQGTVSRAELRVNVSSAGMECEFSSHEQGINKGQFRLILHGTLSPARMKRPGMSAFDELPLHNVNISLAGMRLATLQSDTFPGCPGAGGSQGSAEDHATPG